MQKDIEVIDEKGEKVLELVQFEEVLMPKVFVDQYPNGSIAEKLKQIKDMPFSDGDLMLCSFPKTGTHWSFNLLSLILYNGPMEESPSFMPNCVDVFPVEDISSMPGPKVVDTHLMFPRLPTKCFNDHKVVLIVRNPKDTVVSMYCHLQRAQVYQSKQSWDNFQGSFINGKVPVGPYTAYLKSYEEAIRGNTNIKIHVVYYEDLKQNGLEEMRKLQKHLGYNHSDERLQAILERCSLERLKDDVTEGRTNTVIRDTDGKPVLYRKGEVGDWKNYFTVAQSEAFDAEWEAQMKDSMFHFRYT